MIGTITAMGVIVGSSIPMFMGAMIVGPLSAWVLKQFDRKIKKKITAGFEMLINNFSLGIVGAILTAIALKGVLVKIVSDKESALHSRRKKTYLYPIRYAFNSH